MGLERTAGSGADDELQSPGDGPLLVSLTLSQSAVEKIEWAGLDFCYRSSCPLQLFYKNGQPFPAHRPVGLRVNITHIELALDIPVTQEVLQEPESNVVKVAFTVRKAGRYEVAVKLGGLNVAYSPYYKIFQPGMNFTSIRFTSSFSFGVELFSHRSSLNSSSAPQAQLSHQKPR